MNSVSRGSCHSFVVGKAAVLARDVSRPKLLRPHFVLLFLFRSIKFQCSQRPLPRGSSCQNTKPLSHRRVPIPNAPTPTLCGTCLRFVTRVMRDLFSQTLTHTGVCSNRQTMKTSGVHRTADGGAGTPCLQVFARPAQQHKQHQQRKQKQETKKSRVGEKRKQKTRMPRAGMAYSDSLQLTRPHFRSTGNLMLNR